MNDEKQHCGVEPDYCEGCSRPDEIKDACRAVHRLVKEAADVALATNKPSMIAALIELLAAMATDLALRTTLDPDLSLRVIRRVVCDRMHELITENGLPTLVQPDKPGEKPIVH